MEEEIWKDIAGYEGYYQVSNLGRVKRLPTCVRASYGSKQFRSSHILRYKESRGYNAVCLSKNGEDEKYLRVGRLVAMAFIPNPENLPQVNHKDCNRRNDRADNLEWCTAKYNNNYAEHNKKLSEAAKRRFKDPIQYALLVERVRRICQDPVWKARQRAAQLNNSNSKAVNMLDMKGNYIKTFPSLAEANRQTGIPSQNIGRCCKGGLNYAGGYKWEYK